MEKRSWDAFRALIRAASHERRTIYVEADRDLAHELDSLGLTCCVADPAVKTPDANDVWVVSSRRVADSRELRQTFARAAVVLCGPASISEGWRAHDDLIPRPVVAALPRSPREDPAVWRGTLRKLTSRDVFGLPHYFSVDVVQQHVVVSRGSGRERLRSTVQVTMESAGLANRVASALGDAADELVLRAFAAYGATSIADTVIPVGQEIRVAVATDAATVGISVSDLFSRTSAEEMARSLAAAFAPRAVEDIQDLALLNAARSASHVAVNLLEHEAIETICLLGREDGRRARTLAAVPRSFALFGLGR